METISLFDFPIGMPLPARVRPERLEDLVGQAKVLSSSGPLSSFIQASENLPSMILYGPPGTGKTTIARIMAKLSGRRLWEISAINSSIAELREAFEASNHQIISGQGSMVVFIDEIHRFSKVQQESVLKAVEQGEIVLIGATTENPRFALTPAVLSRCLLIELEPLNPIDIQRVLTAALLDERGLANNFIPAEGLFARIASLAGGDARKALSLLETASVTAKTEGRSEITVEDVSKNISVALARYDADGDQHYDIISAFIKSVRGSDPEAALHYLARMIVGGEDPRFIARRLAILAAEDIGLADPNALVLANSVMQLVTQIGMPEGRIPLAELTIYLALCPKSNSAYKAINAAIADVEAGFSPQIPQYLRSSPASQSDESYQYPHDTSNKLVAQEYLSQEHTQYYIPQSLGAENQMGERLKRIEEIRAKLGL